MIWSFSLEGGRASTLTSNRVLRLVENYLGRFAFVRRVLGLSDSSRYAVQQNFRKLAHFFEYMMFGLLTQSLLAAMRRVNGHTMVHGLSLGLLVAVIDETLQMVQDRGPSLTDVWLDLIGVLFGSLIVWILYGFASLFRRKAPR